MYKVDVRTRWLVLFTSLLLALVCGVKALGAPKEATPPGAQTQPSNSAADQLVVKSLRSELQYSYAGTQVLASRTPDGSNTVVCKVYHKKPDKYRTELEQIGGDGNQVTIDDSRYVWTYSDRGDRVKQDDSPSAGSSLIPWQKRKQLVESNYSSELLGYEKIAGRSTGIVVLYPRWSSQGTATTPAWRYWIDTDTGITLRTERYSFSGELVEVRYFTEITINPNMPDSLFKPSPPKGAELVSKKWPKLMKSLDELSDKVKVPVKLQQKLPMGYEFVWGSLRKHDDQSIMTLWYTDGLATVSVYQSFPPSGSRARSLEVGGNTSVFESSTDLADVTIVADMNPEDLMKMAQDALDSMGLQLPSPQAVSKSMQDRVQERLKSIWKMLGLPPPDPQR